MTDEQPTQPLTDAELVAIHDAYTKSQKVVSGIVGDPTGPYAKDCGGNAIRHVGHLLAEVDRLRAELAAQAQKLEERTTQWRALLNLRDRDAKDYRELKARMDQLRDEIEEYRQNV